MIHNKKKKRQGYLLVLCLAAALLCTACGVWNKEQGVSSLPEAKEKEKQKDADRQPQEEPVEPQPVKITISAAGDCTFAPTQTHGYNGSFHQYYDRYGAGYFMEGVSPLFAEDDFTLVNLECALTNQTTYADKEFVLAGKPEYASILSQSSVEGCSLANNHTSDCGEGGLADTKMAVSGEGVAYAYYGEPGIYKTKQGITIGFVSSSLLSQGADREQSLEQGITGLRSMGVDLVIACCHWGVERTYYPTDYQVRMAHQCIDWGADLVIGCHPHVLQGVEEYQGKMICYSLGNFCFGGNSNPTDKDTMIYQQTFTFLEGALQPGVEARLVPCTVSSVSSHNDYQPTIAAGEKGLQILQDLRTYSAPYSGVVIGEDGTIRLPERF